MQLHLPKIGRTPPVWYEFSDFIEPFKLRFWKLTLCEFVAFPYRQLRLLKRELCLSSETLKPKKICEVFGVISYCLVCILHYLIAYDKIIKLVQFKLTCFTVIFLGGVKLHAPAQTGKFCKLKGACDLFRVQT